MMFDRIKSRANDNAVKKWLKFLIGLTFLALIVGFFGSGYTPPGIFGEVVRQNQIKDIDASPLFYSEVENMFELEEGVKRLRNKNSPAYIKDNINKMPCEKQSNPKNK